MSRKEADRMTKRGMSSGVLNLEPLPGVPGWAFGGL